MTAFAQLIPSHLKTRILDAIHQSLASEYNSYRYNFPTNFSRLTFENQELQFYRKLNSKDVSITAENDIPPRYNGSREANYNADADNKDNLPAVALPIPQGYFRYYAPLRLQFTLLCTKEIPSNSNVFRVKALC